MQFNATEPLQAAHGCKVLVYLGVMGLNRAASVRGRCRRRPAQAQAEIDVAGGGGERGQDREYGAKNAHVIRTLYSPILHPIMLANIAAGRQGGENFHRPPPFYLFGGSPAAFEWPRPICYPDMYRCDSITTCRPPLQRTGVTPLPPGVCRTTRVIQNMEKQITWGILGTGDIARQMADDLRLVAGAHLRAVASRTVQRAETFGDTHNIPDRYGDYESLMRDPEVDVVYIATPHSRHCEDTLRCLEHGKHVLCEKPMAVNEGQVARMQEAARVRGRFLMEALWTAFFPAMEAALAELRAGRIGTPRLLTADFSYKATAGPESRLFNPALAGGALLDIGVYTVALADMVFGREPESIHTAWTPAKTGVDESAAMILDYGEGRRALLSTSLAFDAPQDARVAGDDGILTIPHRFSQPDAYTIQVGGSTESRSYPREGFGYHLEAAAVTKALREGRVEDPRVPPGLSLRVIRTLDRIRKAWGLRYPMEGAGD